MKKRRLTSDKADELKVKSKRPLRKGRHRKKKEVGRTSKITDWFLKMSSIMQAWKVWLESRKKRSLTWERMECIVMLLLIVM